MKILLINLPFYEKEFFKKDFFSRGGQGPLFPLGLASIASFVAKKGYNVEILDIYAEQLRYDEVIEILGDKEFDVVGISALVTQYSYLNRIAKYIKNIKNVPIILGNGLGTASYDVILRHVSEVDICVKGEGEITFYELLENNFSKLKTIQGIAYRENGKIVNNPDRPLIENLDMLPFPAYDLLDMDKYMSAKFYETGYFNIRTKYNSSLKIVPIVTGRGCPYSCKFCGKVIPKSRLRTIPNIMEEISFLIKNYNIEGLHFMDELVVVNKKRILELCREIKRFGLLWDCQGRIDTVDIEVLKTMKESGCVAIGFGIESGSQKILNNMNKNITVEQIRNAMNIARKVDLIVKTQLIFGYPGETIETIEETIKLMKDVGDQGRIFSYVCPLPGSALYREALEKNMIGNEKDFLYKIRDNFEYGKPAINFTAFKTEKIKEIMNYYYNKMVYNHFIYLLKHPRIFLKRFIEFKIGTLKLATKALLFFFRRNVALS